MPVRLKKIRDDLTPEEHRQVAADVRAGKFDGIELSYLGGAYGPTWSETEDYDLSFLDCYDGLRALSVFLPGLTSLDPLKTLAGHLEWLNLGEAKTKSLSLRPIGGLDALTTLSFARNTKDLEHAIRAPNLRELALTGYTERSLRKVSALKELERLYVGFGTCTELDFVREMSKLRSLELLWIKKLSDLTALQGLHALERLSLSTLKQVTELPSLASLSHLASVTLDTLNGLESLSGLEQSTVVELAILNSRVEPHVVAALSGKLPELRRFALGLSTKESTDQALEAFDDALCCPVVEFEGHGRKSPEYVAES